MCYAAIALITDYDTGVEGEAGVEPVTQAEVFAFFKSNLDRVRTLLFDVIAAVPEKRSCNCGEAVGPL
jgi:5'-methylthioadenosine phosphorylase